MADRRAFYLVARWNDSEAIPFFRCCGTEEEAKTLLRDLRRQSRANHRESAAKWQAIGIRRATPALPKRLTIQWEDSLADGRQRRKWAIDHKAWTQRINSFGSALGAGTIDSSDCGRLFRDEWQLSPLEVLASRLAAEIIGDDGSDQRSLAAKPDEGEGNGGTGTAPKKSRSPKPAASTVKRGRPVDNTTIQRADFAKPLREQGKTWEEVAASYARKYPKDIDASADTIRLACTPKRGRKQEPK